MTIAIVPKAAEDRDCQMKVVQLVLRLAKENPTWGYDGIAGAIENLGHSVSDQSVANILKQHGIEPTPDRERSMTWRTFLKAHWDVLAAIDFTTVEVWIKGGLVTFYLLFVVDVITRRVHFAGCTTQPNEAWMKRAACELTNFEDGFLNGSRYLIMDRDTKFTNTFRSILDQSDIASIVLSPQSPNMNADIERFMRSIKCEYLNRMIFFGERTLRNAVKQYLDHYHTERNHQGLDNKLIVADDPRRAAGKIEYRERLGGMLRYYYRYAA